MTWREFVSATIGQLVWPIVVLVLVHLLKDSIKQLAASPRLSRLKAGPAGVEVEFREELEVAKKELEEAGTPKIQSGPEVPLESIDFLLDMKRLADLSPRSVVLETYNRLQSVLKNVLADEIPDMPRGMQLGLRSLGRRAQNRGILSEAEAAVLDDLSLMRNRIAHEPDESISAETALEYVQLASQLALAARLAAGQTALQGSPL